MISVPLNSGPPGNGSSLCHKRRGLSRSQVLNTSSAATSASAATASGCQLWASAVQTGVLTAGTVTGLGSLGGVAWLLEQSWTRLAPVEDKIEGLEDSHKQARQELLQGLKDIRLETQQGFSRLDGHFCRLEAGMKAATVSSVVGAAVIFVSAHTRR